MRYLQYRDQPFPSSMITGGPNKWDLHLWMEPWEGKQRRTFEFNIKDPSIFDPNVTRKEMVIRLIITQLGFAGCADGKDFDIFGFFRLRAEWDLHVRGIYSPDSRSGWLVPLVEEHRSECLPRKIRMRDPFPNVGVTPFVGAIGTEVIA